MNCELLCFTLLGIGWMPEDSRDAARSSQLLDKLSQPATFLTSLHVATLMWVSSFSFGSYGSMRSSWETGSAHVGSTPSFKRHSERRVKIKHSSCTTYSSSGQIIGFDRSKRLLIHLEHTLWPHSGSMRGSLSPSSSKSSSHMIHCNSLISSIFHEQQVNSACIL